MSIQLTLERILTKVAKDKGVKNVSLWVESKLSHCEIRSDYTNFVKMTSRKGMFFGVGDRKFDCGRFILYVEYMQNSEIPPERECVVYTFKSLEDEGLQKLLREAYQYNFDCICEVRFYCDMVAIPFEVRLPSGKVCKLKEYNDEDTMCFADDLDFVPALYVLRIKGGTICCVARDRIVVEMELLKIPEIFDVEIFEDSAKSMRGSAEFKVYYAGELQPYYYVEPKDGSKPYISWVKVQTTGESD